MGALRQARDDKHSSGIRLKDSSGPLAIDVHVPPLDPLPRLWDDEAEGMEPAFARERIVVDAPREVTSQRGVPISIAPCAASVGVLSSRPPRSPSPPASANPAQRNAEYVRFMVILFVLCFTVTLIAGRVFVFD